MSTVRMGRVEAALSQRGARTLVEPLLSQTPLLCCLFLVLGFSP